MFDAMINYGECRMEAQMNNNQLQGQKKFPEVADEQEWFQ